MPAAKKKSIFPEAIKRRFFPAVRKGDIATVEQALGAGADVHRLDGNKWTALHEACRHGQLEMVEFLLAKGLDPNAHHPSIGYTPLFVATFEPGYPEIVKALLGAGAAPSLPVNENNFNALHSAAVTGNLEVLELLLAAGGDPGARAGHKQATAAGCVKDPELEKQVVALIKRYATTPRQTTEQARDAALRTRVPESAAPYRELAPLRLEILEVTGAPHPATKRALERLRAGLAKQLPDGYEDMMRAVGPGVLRHTVRVHGPRQILGEVAEWRRRIKKYWFWGKGPLLSKSAAQKAVRIADTLDGDELVFVPSEPDTLLMLPREDEEVQLLSRTGLLSALARIIKRDSARMPRRVSYEPMKDAIEER